MSNTHMANMSNNEEERLKIQKKLENYLDNLFKNKPYMLTLSVIEDYKQGSDNKIQMAHWSFSRVGQIDVATAPYPKVYYLVQLFNSNIQNFLQNFMKYDFKPSGEQK